MSYKSWPELLQDILYSLEVDYDPEAQTNFKQFQDRENGVYYCINKLSIMSTYTEYKGDYVDVPAELFEKVHDLYHVVSSPVSIHRLFLSYLELSEEELAVKLLSNDKIERELAQAILTRDRENKL